MKRNKREGVLSTRVFSGLSSHPQRLFTPQKLYFCGGPVFASKTPLNRRGKRIRESKRGRASFGWVEN